MRRADERLECDVIVTKDEMNLVEIPFGPITSADVNYLSVSSEVFDRVLMRRVTRSTVITGSRLFGLPRPIDDQVLVGMQALTYEAGYTSRKVEFSRYQLCKMLGWATDGRSYRRLENSFDRIAGTTLKFKDAWYDKGEREWKSKTFHLIDEVNLCSQDQLLRVRRSNGRCSQRLCSFVWNETVWKSFEDGFIKSLDMRMFRRISNGRRREVPLRLFRILDKRFYRASKVKFDLKALCVDKLGLSPNYGPSQMLRVIARAADWLVECEYLRGYQTVDRASLLTSESNGCRPRQIVFYKKSTTRKRVKATLSSSRALVDIKPNTPDSLRLWLERQQEEDLRQWEEQALDAGFGSQLERKLIENERNRSLTIYQAGRVRQEFVHRFAKRTNERLQTLN